MPLYAFDCPACGHQLEEIRGVSDGNPLCPRCKEKRGVSVVVKKRITAHRDYKIKGDNGASTRPKGNKK